MKKKMMMVFIPVDIVRIILRHVPAESLLRFKLVCKQWRSMINDDPLFPKVDMLLFTTSRLKSEFNDYAVPLGSLFSSSSKTIHAKKINTPRETLLPIIISSSCNGFFLCSVSYRDRTVWNPFSGAQLDLPQVFETSDRLGLGYCVKTNDYKVVRIYNDYNLNRKRTSIYSVKSRAWHNIEDFPGHSTYDGVLVNGSLYFLVVRGSVISLDLTTETYSKLPLPNCTDHGSGFRALYSLDGHLLLSNQSEGKHALWDLWILQDFGNENGKWNKLITLSGKRGTMFSTTPIAYRKSKEQIVVSNCERFEWFDLKTNTRIKEVTFKAGFRVIGAHVGSVSLDWFNGKPGDDFNPKRSWCFKKRLNCFRG